MADRWYKLDNAAKIFPALSYNNSSNYFRVSAVLKEDVNVEILKEALKISLKRFPTFKVRLRRGIFWYYFDSNESTPLVKKESAHLFDTVNTDEHNRFLFSVQYNKKRISLELHHALTDGTGGMEFFKTIVYYYLVLNNKQITNDGSIISEEYEKLSGETEDSFSYNYNKKTKKLPKEKKAYKIKGTPYASDRIGIIHASMSVSELKQITKELNVTINQYLSAVICFVIAKRYNDAKKRPVVLFTPVNARKIFASKSLRNFVLFVRTSLNMKEKQDYTFLEVLDIIKQKSQENLTKEHLTSRLVANVKIERNFLIRILPLFIKNFVMKLSYKALGSNLTTISFSNLGQINVPKEFYDHVSQMYFMIGTTQASPMSMAASSYNDTLTISFASKIIERTIQKDFIRFLSNQGLKITVQTNDLEVE